MNMRSSKGRIRLGTVAALAGVLLTTTLVSASSQTPAYGYNSGQPPFPTNCPGAQYPPKGYPLRAAPISYEVPFKAIIFGGNIAVPPNAVVPNIDASLCGLVRLPDLAGTITGGNINIGYQDANGKYDTVNLYVGGLEALPSQLAIASMTSTIAMTPAANGGLDIELHGITFSSVTTIGMTCNVTLDARFSTISDGTLTGEPVTGPSQSGQAEVVSNSFTVPGATDAPGHPPESCPPSIAATFDKLLGLPAHPGVGKFAAPFCFDFELEGPNNPAAVPNPATGKAPLNPHCPWPSH